MKDDETRDMFAAHAMAALLAKAPADTDECHGGIDALVSGAWRWADAMMAERARRLQAARDAELPVIAEAIRLKNERVAREPR